MTQGKTRVILLSSYRGGTGKSTLTANLAGLAALSGKQIGMVDACSRSPSLSVFFGLSDGKRSVSLSDLNPIREAVVDVTPALNSTAAGRLYLGWETARSLATSFDLALFLKGLQYFSETLNLDALFIDAEAGMAESNLAMLALPDIALILLRPDEQDYQGTAVLVDVARKLRVPQVRLVANQVTAHYDFADVKQEMETAFGCPTAAVLPFSEEVTAAGGLFALRRPRHPFSLRLRELADKLLEG